MDCLFSGKRLSPCSDIAALSLLVYFYNLLILNKNKIGIVCAIKLMRAFAVVNNSM